MKLGGLVVVASNAGGAWTEVSQMVSYSLTTVLVIRPEHLQSGRTPIGDITTTMLYIGGQAGRPGTCADAMNSHDPNQ